MHHSAFLNEIVIIFGTALVATWMFRVVRAPSIIGFIFTGIVIGPPGLGLIHHESVQQFAELGLVLLLFTIGLELSPKPLLHMGKSLFIASFMQIGLTALLATAVTWLVFGAGPLSAAIIGVAVALSSTAIVLKILSDQRETDTLRGRITTGMLLVQDVVVIVLMLFLPLLASGSENGEGNSAVLKFVYGMIGLLVVVVLGRRILPLLLEHVVRPGGGEHVTLFAVVMAFGGAALAGLVDWSLPLGACIAGLLLSAADERHQIVADILPFRDVFNALFFISLGMFVKTDVIVENALVLALLVVITVVGKAMITALSVRAGAWPLRPAIQAGIGLCTVSEFGYVLASQADKLGILDTGLLDKLTVFALGTMAAGALMVPYTDLLTNRLLRIIPQKQSIFDLDDDAHPHLKNHIIIVGYGVNGHNLARVFQSTHLPYCIVEMSPRLAKEAKEQGAEVLLGDASRMAILREAGLEDARALVVAINDPGATSRIVARARDGREDLFILARTRFVFEIDRLYTSGANLVIPEEFETSIEIAAHVLKKLSVPDNVVEGQVAAIRAGGYGMLRGKPTDRKVASDIMAVLQSTVTRTHYVAEDAFAAGKTLAELDLRAASGVTVIAIVRNGTPTTNPDADHRIEPDDVLVLVGAHAQLEAARKLLNQSP